MSTETPSVLVDVADGVGAITLDRPDQMNAITIQLGTELEAAVVELGARDDVSVITIRGAGGNFCAGGDFQEVERLRAGGPAALEELFVSFRRACRAVEDVAQPVVALVEGVAMAGGFELIQSVDVTLVRSDAKIADNHINFGQVPGGGGSQKLARLVGRARALSLLLTGARLNGDQLVAWGLAHRSFAAEEFDAGVDEIVSRMAGRRRDALVGIKSLVREGESLDIDAALDLELRTVVAHIAGEAGASGVGDFSQRKDPS